MVDFQASYVRSQRISPIGRSRSLLTTVVIYGRSSESCHEKKFLSPKHLRNEPTTKKSSYLRNNNLWTQAPWQHHHFEATFHKAPLGRQGLFGYQKWTLFQWFLFILDPHLVDGCYGFCSQTHIIMPNSQQTKKNNSCLNHRTKCFCSRKDIYVQYSHILLSSTGVYNLTNHQPPSSHTCTYSV